MRFNETAIDVSSNPPAVTKTTLYRVVGWILRRQSAGRRRLQSPVSPRGRRHASRALAVDGVLGVAATGVLFLILLVPLYYVARATDR
ncbi:hypothetical protein [Natrinema soli]|uniref:Sugar ABC transporter permease n=1 Tax=Natrinema soli TaxID=1930624 RepID=A0ABD5T1Z4_9EURY